MEVWETYYCSFFTRIGNDPRIGKGHMAVFSGLFYLWMIGGRKNFIKVYSKEAMLLTKISSKITYLKIIDDLSCYGYIQYEPSRSKHYPSEIKFLAVTTN